MTRAAEPEPSDIAPTHTLVGRMFYDTLWVLCRNLGVALFGIRYRFAEPLPREGGLLVLSSHQSNLDPLLLGLVCERRLSSLARSSLFRWGPFGAIISALDAVPIDREASSVAAMKTIIRKLRGGGAVTIFPEGTRTRDGRLGEVQSGFALVAKRAGVPILPVAIVGAWECWPRTRGFPLPGRIRLEFGPIIPAADVAAMDVSTLVALVAQQLTELDAEARRLRDGGAAEPSPRRAAFTAAKSAGRRRAAESPAAETGARVPEETPPSPQDSPRSPEEPGRQDSPASPARGPAPAVPLEEPSPPPPHA
jgi:1-acyl-sn-glycerol-3-phosphate acyltransferase